MWGGLVLFGLDSDQSPDVTKSWFRITTHIFLAAHPRRVSGICIKKGFYQLPPKFDTVTCTTSQGQTFHLETKVFCPQGKLLIVGLREREKLASHPESHHTFRHSSISHFSHLSNVICLAGRNQ